MPIALPDNRQRGIALAVFSSAAPATANRTLTLLPPLPWF